MMIENNKKDSITLDEAYDAMLVFIEEFWKLRGMIGDEVPSMLGSMQRPVKSKVDPLDPALWDDWCKAVDKVRTRD